MPCALGTVMQSRTPSRQRDAEITRHGDRHGHGARGPMHMSRLTARRRLWAIPGGNGWNLADTPGTPTGLLVVRIWREQRSEDPLRIHARITSTVDVMGADDRTLVVDSAEDVSQAVREWLRRYLMPYSGGG
jgi:hypothetical protein